MISRNCQHGGWSDTCFQCALAGGNTPQPLQAAQKPAKPTKPAKKSR